MNDTTTMMIAITTILSSFIILSILFPSLADVERWSMIRRVRNHRFNCRKRNARLRADHAWHMANRAIEARAITSGDVKDVCTANGACTITWKPSKSTSPRSSQYWEEIEDGLRAAAAEWYHST